MKLSLTLTLTFFPLLLGSCQAFQSTSTLFPPQKTTLSTTTTTTALDAAISPRSTASASVPSVKRTKDLKIKRGETVLEPYYGIPNGILLAAPSILALHAGKNEEPRNFGSH